MKTGTVRKLLIAGAAIAAAVLVLAGCPFTGTGVTVTGSFIGYYFDISSDVTVTITEGDVSLTVDVPVASDGNADTGAFYIANVPAGTYAVTVTFQNPSGWTSGTEYSLDGDTYQSVDSEVVTGTADPYTFTITIDSLTIDADTTLDLNFGNVG